MSRSHRKYPFFHFVGPDSQATWKRSYHRTFRRGAKQHLLISWEDEDLVFPTIDEVADPWLSPQDGTGRYTPFRPGYQWWTKQDEDPRFSHFRAALMK